MDSSMHEDLREAVSSLDSDHRQTLFYLLRTGRLAPLLDTAIKDPEFIDNLLNDTVTEEPVLDYITDLELRCQLFLDLTEMSRRVESPHRPNMAVFAFFMIAPLNSLQLKLKRLREYLRHNQIDALQIVFQELGPVVVTGIEAFIFNLGPPKPDRSINAVEICQARDGRRCPFTGIQDPEATRISPRYSFHISRTLELFWSSEAAEAFSVMLQDGKIAKSPQNLICLHRQLSKWYNHAQMALKPLRKVDNHSIMVQIHWLKGNELQPTQTFSNEAVTTDTLITQAGLADNQSWGELLACRWSGLRLETGQTFILRAEDPKHAPSFELLQLSWDFLRVAAICGAAKAMEEE